MFHVPMRSNVNYTYSKLKTLTAAGTMPDGPGRAGPVVVAAVRGQRGAGRGAGLVPGCTSAAGAGQ